MRNRLHSPFSTTPRNAGRREVWSSCALGLALSLTGLASPAMAEGGFAIRAAKALVCGTDGRGSVDNAVVLVKDGLIEAVGPQRELEIPEGYEIVDAGDSWVVPGLIDLHTHMGGGNGYNDMVYQLNPGLRISTTVIPGHSRLKRPRAQGITTVLAIPGSGTNIGGQGILMKTHEVPYEEMIVRDPGSMKLAQGDNPKRWGYTMNRALMNHHIRHSLTQGRAYAEDWLRYERGEGPKPERHINLDIYRDLVSERTQISVHTQYFQVVLATLRLLRMEAKMPCYIDHGSFDSYKLGAIAEEIGVAAILGPREVMWARPPSYDTDGRCEGTAWGFQQQGHTLIGFNTDAPVVPSEELPLQSAMGVRYGFDNSQMDALRGLTIVPAIVGGLDDRLGSIEPGKVADLVVITGDPSDPRSAVDFVWIEGELVYEREEGSQVW